MNIVKAGRCRIVPSKCIETLTLPAVPSPSRGGYCISERTRKLSVTLTDLARMAGTTPNLMARNFKMKKSRALGFIASDINNPFYVDFFRHIDNDTREQGYKVLIADSERNIDKEKDNIENMLQNQVEGLLVFPVIDILSTYNADHLLDLKLEHIPFVLLGKIPNHPFSYVVSEEVESSRRIARHLIDLGHKRLGLVLDHRELDRPSIERYQGIAQGLIEQGLCREDEIDGFIHKIYVEDADWEAQLEALLRAGDAPTALIPISDVIALMMNRPLNRMGICVPGELSIVTYGDNIWSRYLSPSLTSIKPDIGGIARKALEVLMQRIEEPDAPIGKYLIPQELVLRESTGPVMARR